MHAGYRSCIMMKDLSPGRCIFFDFLTLPHPCMLGIEVVLWRDLKLKVVKPKHRILDSIVVSISACHADDPGSIPGRGVFFFSSIAEFESNIFITPNYVQNWQFYKRFEEGGRSTPHVKIKSVDLLGWRHPCSSNLIKSCHCWEQGQPHCIMPSLHWKGRVTLLFNFGASRNPFMWRKVSTPLVCLWRSLLAARENSDIPGNWLSHRRMSTFDLLRGDAVYAQSHLRSSTDYCFHKWLVGLFIVFVWILACLLCESLSNFRECTSSGAMYWKSSRWKDIKRRAVTCDNWGDWLMEVTIVTIKWR